MLPEVWSFQELLIVVFIALIVLGPLKLPQMARDLGHFVSEARGAVDEVQPGVEEPEEERASSKE
jgi:Tat protein translocase TatB subunit